METQAKKTVCIDVHVPFGPSRGEHRLAAPMPKAGDDIKRAYVQAMLREIEVLAPDLDGAQAAAVHVCGNGPWALPEGGLGEVLSAIRHTIGLAADAEVLLDVLPGRLTPRQLDQSLACGVNRIDMELASSSFAEIKALGVPYNVGDFCHAKFQKSMQHSAPNGRISSGSNGESARKPAFSQVGNPLQPL